MGFTVMLFLSFMIIRSKAPLRLGLAGGGTDVSPYSDLYGGYILNATVNLYAHATIEVPENGKIELVAVDQGKTLTFDPVNELPVNGELDLLKGVYNYVVRNFTKKPLSFRLTTSVDAPPGSGLGSSSTLVVTILGAFAEWLQLPLGEYDFAHMAYEIERVELGLEGGKQDQYAATFGGFNFMEFYGEDKVIVNPLRIRKKFVRELKNNLVLCYTGTSRESAQIIKTQTANITSNSSEALEATHTVKEQSIRMKEALLTGRLDQIGKILDDSWQSKKRMASGITNPQIDRIYETAIGAGATGGKISGAGGGGFMFFYCPVNSRFEVLRALESLGVHEQMYEFTESGLYTYTIR